MIPNCQSLEEAITYVTDPAVKEELEYQYDKYKQGYEEVLAHEIELECSAANYDELQEDYENLQREYDDMEERADQYESDAEICHDIREEIRFAAGHDISITAAQNILNAILHELGMEKCEVINCEEKAYQTWPEIMQ